MNEIKEGMKCIVTSEFLKWYNEVPVPLPSQLVLGDEVEIIYFNEKRGTGIIKNHATNCCCGGVPQDVLKEMSVKR